MWSQVNMVSLPSHMGTSSWTSSGLLSSHAEPLHPPSASRLLLGTASKKLQSTVSVGPPSKSSTYAAASLPRRSQSQQSATKTGIEKIERAMVSTQAAPTDSSTTSTKSTTAEEVETLTVTPDEHYIWHLSHLGNWHGQLMFWEPKSSPKALKCHRTIRSLTAEDETKEKYTHWNLWYNVKGDLDWNSGMGPWHISKEQHSHPDGMSHPFFPTRRVLTVTPQGDCAGAFVRIDKEGEGPYVSTEIFFMNGPDSRFSVVMTYSRNGTYWVVIILEDALPTADKPDATWMGNAWDHNATDLLPHRDPPQGSYPGELATINLGLEVTKKKGSWAGFYADVPESEQGEYDVVHLPNNVTAAFPKKPPAEKGGKLIATWVVSDSEIRQQYLTYGDDLELNGFTSATYHKEV